MDLGVRAVQVGMWGRFDGLMYEVYNMYQYEESNNDVGQLGVLMKVKCYHSISYLSQHRRRRGEERWRCVVKINWRPRCV